MKHSDCNHQNEDKKLSEKRSDNSWIIDNLTLVVILLMIAMIVFYLFTLYKEDLDIMFLN